MGISIASGMPPTAGLITGIIGGIVVGLIAGSPLQVSGPAAGLSVLVLQLVQNEQIGLGLIGIVVLLAGLLQLTAGMLKLGQWFRAVSPAVIHGMLAGIGVLIFCAQFHVMLDGKPIGTGIQNLMGLPKAIYDAVTVGDSRLNAAEIGLLTIATIFAWGSLTPKSWRVVPAPLVGVVVGMIVAAIFQLDQIKHVVVPDNILADTIFPTLDKWALLADTDVLKAVLIGAVSVAFIASAETLLCATAVDQMHTGPRTKYDQELSAQGVGNFLCGLFGVLPMTGVIVRSSANVEAGAVSRNSAILHGVWLLLFCALLPWTLRYIPVSALAAVLVFTGYKLAYPKILPTLLKFGKGEVFIYAATVLTIVMTNLLDGVVLGLLLSMAKLLYAFSHLDIRKEESASGDQVDLHLKGSATLIKLPALAAELETLKPGANVRVHIGELDYIDHACIDLLTNWDKQRKAMGGSLDIQWDELKSRYDKRSGTPEAKAARAGMPS